MSERSGTPLDRVPVGGRGIVAVVGPDHRAALAREGVEAGSRLMVEASSPFGGPIVVRLGRARLALARAVARTIELEHDLCHEPVADARVVEALAAARS